VRQHLGAPCAWRRRTLFLNYRVVEPLLSRMNGRCKRIIGGSISVLHLPSWRGTYRAIVATRGRRAPRLLAAESRLPRVLIMRL